MKGEQQPDRQDHSNSRKPTIGDRRSPLELKRGSDIADRLLDLAASVLLLVRSMPKDFTGRHVCSQVIRATTSAGANYEEARAAESRADFVHKLAVALKETRETAYWLRLIIRAGWQQAPIEPVLCEALELCAILGKSIRTAKDGARDNPREGPF